MSVRIKRRAVVGAVVMAGMATAAAAYGSTSPSSRAKTSSGSLKVAFVYAAPAQDGGWDSSLDAARKAAQKELGNKVSITYKANVADGPQDTVVFNQLANAGYNVIVATSFGQQQASLALAQAHPNIKVLQVEAEKTLPNLASYDYRGSDGFYIAGMATAAATHADKLGFVGAFAIPTSLAQINAFELGAQQINRKVKTRVIWTNNWFDLSKSQQAAQAAVNSGAKGLAYLTTGAAIAKVAGSANVAWNGFEVDQRKLAPKQYITAPILNWKPYFVSQLKAMLAGTWKTNDYLGTMANGGIQIAPFGTAFNAASTADQKKIRTAMSQLRSGKRYVFTGPIVSQSGKTEVAAGKRLPVAGVYTTNYLVKGVQGNVPAGG